MTPAADKTTGEREVALAPYLELLVAARSDETEVGSPVTLDDQTLALDSWEQEVLRTHTTGVDPEGHPWPALVLEGLAFVAKCQSRAQQEDTDAPSPEELIVETAAGVAILKELQSSVDQLIQGGRIKEVKPLSEFRIRIRQGVDGMRSFLDAGTFSLVEARAIEMLAARTRPTATPPTREPAKVERRRVPTQFKREPAAVRVSYGARKDRPRLMVPLLTVLIVCVATWVGFFIAQPRQASLPELTLGQFDHISAVRSIEARPPSLFVKLNESVWNGMAREDRLQTIHEIGLVAKHAGYLGAQVWLDSGSSVGRWSEKHGPELIRTSPEGS